MMEFSFTMTFTADDVADLLCSAFEGGSNYWYVIEEKIDPTRWEHEERPCYSTKELAEKNINKHYVHWYPLNPGGALIIGDVMGEDKKKYRLDESAIRNGLRTMAHAYPRHFANFMSENWDSDTADVFLQCCLFGQLIYG